jgi:hypothetical protein
MRYPVAVRSVKSKETFVAVKFVRFTQRIGFAAKFVVAWTW